MINKKLTKEEKDLCRLITPEFRVSYPHIFVAQSPKPADKKKFSIQMLFDKTKTLQGSSRDGKPRTLQEVIKNAKILAFGPDKKSWPKDLRSPVLDGDDPKYADKVGYKGCWVIKATANEDSRPSAVGPDMTPITEASEFYPGCYARAYIFSRVYDYMGNQGVHFILDHVQKTRDGQSFGGKKPIEQVFSPVQDISLSDEDDTEEVDFK